MPKEEGWVNLVPFADRSEEEQRKIRSQGGKASQAKQKARRTFAETLRAALAREITVEQGKDRLRELGYDGTWMDLLSQAQVERAAKGDTEAFRAVRDTIGESPRQGVDITGLEGKPLADIDLSQLSDDQLRAMIAARESEEEND